jgi:hypothetical protein
VRAVITTLAACYSKDAKLLEAEAQAHDRLARALAHLGDPDAAKREIGLQPQYSQQAKERLNVKLKEVTSLGIRCTLRIRQPSG